MRMRANEIIAAINPNMRLTKSILRDIYACGMEDAQFPEKALAALESAGCSKARQYYRDWVTQYEAEREAMLDRAAHWWHEKEHQERERRARDSIARDRNAKYQFTGFPEDW